MPDPTPPQQPGGQQPYPPPPPYYYPYPQQRKSRWWIPVVIIGGVFMLFIVGIIAFFFIIGSAIGSSFESEPVAVKERSVLYLKASHRLEETEQAQAFSLFTSGSKTPVSFLSTLNAIKRAKDDDNILGIYFEAGDLQAGFAKSAELRNALIDFKKSGKFIYSFIEAGAEDSYYFASVADSIFMPTEGLLEMNGYAVISTFLKGTFDKLGINFYVQQFEEYKSAGETFDRKEYSEPAKRELRAIIDQRYTTFINDVAQSRGLDAGVVRNALNRGVYTTDSLIALGFIDGVRSREATREMIRQHINATSKKGDTLENIRLVSIANYINSSSFRDQKEEVEKDKEIAIVYGSGAIVSGKNQPALFGGENQIASESFIANLRKARDNSKVKAIIIRIDSPGGSVIASDAIWEEIRAARKVKPVYASMSDVAASGGYYMAMACDTIIAHPSTITGSIGVILMLPNFTGAMEKIGMTVDTVATSQSATFLNPMLPLNETERNKLYVLSEQIYKRFVSRVAESRGMSFDSTRAVAKGRVWTGMDAKNVGLVDVLGGLQESIDLAKKRIGVPTGKKVAIHIYPEPEDPFEAFMQIFNSDDDENASLGKQVQGAVQPGIEQTALWQVLPSSVKSQTMYLLHLNDIAQREQTLMALPSLIDIH